MRISGYSSRFPTLRENIQVYAVAATPLYAWSILWLFWEVPSWLNHLTVGEILPIFAYALTINLFESLLILAGLNLLCFLLPQKWFHESFVARSFLLVTLGLGYLMYFASSFGKEADYPTGLLRWSPVVFVLFFSISLLLSRVLAVRNLADVIADRLVIFLYLIAPLSLLAFVVVVVRNLW
jgi:hypothetical protein